MTQRILPSLGARVLPIHFVLPKSFLTSPAQAHLEEPPKVLLRLRIIRQLILSDREGVLKAMQVLKQNARTEPPMR